MLENILVGIILVAAAAFTVYRLFFRPSCGCGSDCGCAKGGCECGKPGANGTLVEIGKPGHTTKGGGCCCGK